MAFLFGSLRRLNGQSARLAQKPDPTLVPSVRGEAETSPVVTAGEAEPRVPSLGKARATRQSAPAGVPPSHQGAPRCSQSHPSRRDPQATAAGTPGLAWATRAVPAPWLGAEGLYNAPCPLTPAIKLQMRCLVAA